MKKEFIIFGILILAFFVIGAGCSENIREIDKVIEDRKVMGEEDVLNPVEIGEEGDILVDRTRYVQAGNPPFDLTNVIFFQKNNRGYKIDVEADKKVKVEVMTDKDCLFKGQGSEYETISTSEGSKVMIVGEKHGGEDRSLCVGATAIGEGQSEVKFKVVELL
jgi:hypothetical protein